MVKIRKHLVSSSIANKVTYSGTNSKKYIVIHETANTSKGANANAHARLQANGNSRSASWHYQVDDKEVVQSFSDNKQCWHAGNSYYNKHAIGIEICVNSDGNFKKAVNNAVDLVKHLKSKYNIPISNVIQHNKASGKPCPHYLRAGTKGVTWNGFINKVKSTKGSHKPASKPKRKTNTKRKANYNTQSIVTFLQSVGYPYSFKYREKIAKAYGIGRGNYSGKMNENIELLKRIKKDYKRTGKIKTGGSHQPVSKRKKSKRKSYKKGQYVTLKKTAKRFATGETIAGFAKGKKYKIIQVKSDRVLLDEIMSWVKKSDIK